MTLNVSVKNVTKKFGEFVALRDISIDVAAGSFVTLLGASGSGKTTMLRVVAGLEEPGAGTVRIGDHVVNDDGVFVPPHRRGLGMVFQSYALWPHMTVYENVRFPLRAQQVHNVSHPKAVATALEMVGLGGYESRLPSTLSGGQQQRVALARALVGEPKIVLYDEPLSNLDAKLREGMREEIRSIHQRLGVTALYVTHDQTEALSLSDEIHLMSFGTILQSGGPRDLFDRPVSRKVAEFIGRANILEGDGFVVDGSDSAWAGLRLRAREASHLAAVQRRAVMIRPHSMTLHARPDECPGGTNTFPATVRDVAFFGDRLDYTIVGPREQLFKVEQLAGTGTHGPGDQVTVAVRPDDCVVVADE